MPIQKGFEGLSNEELVNLIRTGSKEDQNELYAQLYRQNYPLIHKYCKIYARGNPDDIEDFEQESFFALRIAVDRYDENRGKFINCLLIWVKQVITRYFDNVG